MSEADTNNKSKRKVKQSLPEVRDVEAEAAKRNGQFWEVLTLFCLMVWLLMLFGWYVGYFSASSWLYPISLVTVAFVAVHSFFRAHAASFKNIMSARKKRYRLSHKCWETLRCVELPDDVLKLLEGVKDKTFVGERRFQSAIRNALGRERAREVSAVILKYARL